MLLGLVFGPNDEGDESNLLVVKGSVPGHKNCYLIIKKSVKPKKSKPIEKEVDPKEKGGPKAKKQ